MRAHQASGCPQPHTRRRLQDITQRAVSSLVDYRNGCGKIRINSHNVTKCTNCKCSDHRLTAGGIPVEAAYFLEKLALCRLQRCAQPCGARNTSFPRLLEWDDARLKLVSSYEGAALATDWSGSNVRFDHASIAAAARAHGFTTPRKQFECMRRQLREAGVIQLDVSCKNIFVRKDGALVMGDFDMAQVDGFPPRMTCKRCNRSDHDETWDLLLKSNGARPWGACFRRNRTGIYAPAAT